MKEYINIADDKSRLENNLVTKCNISTCYQFAAFDCFEGHTLQHQNMPYMCDDAVGNSTRYTEFMNIKSICKWIQTFSDMSVWMCTCAKTRARDIPSRYTDLCIFRAAVGYV